MAATERSKNAEMEERRKKIIEGFKINSMNMRDAETGKIVWEQEKWDNAFDEEMEIHIPASILRLKAVSREMNFSCRECLSDFNLIQHVQLHGQTLEEWKFHFGFVIPGSTNSWQCVIESAGASNMIPTSVLSGNVVIETKFLDGDMMVCTTRIRVFYDE